MVERSRIKRILNQHENCSEEDPDRLTPDFILDLIYRGKNNDENNSERNGNTTDRTTPGNNGDLQSILDATRSNPDQESIESVTKKGRKTILSTVRGTTV